MPKITKRAKIFRDWDGLLGACDAHADLLPGIGLHIELLEAILTRGRELQIQQETLAANRQGATQHLKESVGEGLEQARKVRRYVQSYLHSRSELLSQFGIAPIRTRLRAVRVTPPTEPEDPNPEVEIAANPPAPETETTTAPAAEPAE